MIRILLLEDDKNDCEIIASRFKTAGIEVELRRVESSALFRAALIDEDWDLVLADYALPRFDGVTAVEMVQQLRPSLPVIMISGVMSEELAVETLKLGAADYVMKQKLDRLVPVTLRALRARDQQKQLLAEIDVTLDTLGQWAQDLTARLGASPDVASQAMEQLQALARRLRETVGRALIVGHYRD